ncbi:glycoside hydrolase family 6 protein [Curtobacterium flaccumfaciens pv. oortii]|uniref:glycoside hydrolase family 6 protein n=1 Tax=Curtobacterium flaccumfaciens TaxID=2035 RepID=UPI001BDDCCC1|nr:glycoside hydrolase family 6 protein [Curtobacterium flaccumfaciens]MBT1621595.1 glycoside hydrolase family 6 protein [Curtobacterium flaccumfaciens pv. oortii]
MRRRPRRAVLCGATVALTALVGTLLPVTGASAATSATTIRSASAASLYGAGPYRSPTSEAAKAATALAAADPAGAAAAATIARYPVATWLGEWTQGAQLTKTISAAVTGADDSGTTPVFVLYAIPDRDCGGYSAGGFSESSYDAWVDQVTAALTGHRAAVIVEPDSLAMLSNAKCSTTLDDQRYRILSRTVAGLTAAGVPAYLDAGNSNWVPPATMAARLNSAGVQQARGFFTNVANYYPTAQEQAYAQKVSAATGGSHYVIDTSRNGQGWRGTWCNGPGAGLGTSPRVVADGTALDALLWVKTPGASDGTCNGAPAAGKWWSSYAQALVANARLGAPAADLAPRGSLEVVAGTGGGVRVTGWAYDEDDPTQSVQVRATVDGAAAGTTSADGDRPDVDAVAGVGRAHGFSAVVPAAEGTRRVCVTAVNTGAGSDTTLGCASVRAYRHDPSAALESAQVAVGGIAVSGWAFDGDDVTSTTAVAFTVDGKAVSTLSAGRARADVDRTWGAGPSHGFAGTVTAGAGKHTVCAVARNVGPGADRVSSPCRTVTVPVAAPVGRRDAVSSDAAGRVRVRGWTFDRDALARPVTVRVTVGGSVVGNVVADRKRSDVDRVHGGGAQHGFDGVVRVAAGSRSVCLTAVGIGRGGDTSLGCATVRVR